MILGLIVAEIEPKTTHWAWCNDMVLFFGTLQHLEGINNTKIMANYQLAVAGCILVLFVMMVYILNTIKYLIKWHDLVSSRGWLLNKGKNNKERQT